jgi:hypothetical protein
VPGLTQAEERDPPEGRRLQIEAAETVLFEESLDGPGLIRSGHGRQVMVEHGHVDGGHDVLPGRLQAFPSKTGPQGRMPCRDEFPRARERRHVKGVARGDLQLPDVHARMRPPCQVVEEHAVLEGGQGIGVLRFCDGDHR